MKKEQLHSKKQFILMLILLVIIIGTFVFKNTNTPLSKIYIEPKFSSGDLLKFQKELTNIETQKDYTGVVNRARKYDYLGYPGKALIVYNNWMKNNKPYRAIYNNVGKLYAKVCKIGNKLNKTYCYKALDNFDILINKYKDPIYYIDISKVYRNLGDTEKAKENYKLYYQGTNGRERRFEKELELEDGFLTGGNLGTGEIE